VSVVRNANLGPDQNAPFQMRGGSFTLMVLRLVNPDDPGFFPQLAGKVRQAPNFFRNAPVVLDLDDLSAGERTYFDFASFARRLVELQLIPIGVQGGSPEMQAAALNAGLPLVPTGRAPRSEPAASTGVAPAPANANGDEANAVDEKAAKPADTAQPTAKAKAPRKEEAKAAIAQRPTLFINEPVRSGQQIYAHQGDLVVTASVSAGAELLADGSIHVYGALRGRALAGIGGDTSARIFCQSLEAELVSIAGLYRVNEDVDEAVYKKPVQVYLSQGYLHLDPLF